MGLFHEMTKVFNRAPIDITVRFDGQDITIKPGEFLLPTIAVPFGKNQNPIMGSASAFNPHISGARYLIVTEKDEGFGIPLTKQEWETHVNRPSRFDEEEFFESILGRGEKMVVMGKGKKTMAKGKFDQHVTLTPAGFEGGADAV
jgi:hypothetical protein